MAGCDDRLGLVGVRKVDALCGRRSWPCMLGGGEVVLVQLKNGCREFKAANV